MPQCPYCKSYGVYAIKRYWWQRLFQLSHRYDCHDCGRVLSRSQLIEGKPPNLDARDTALHKVRYSSQMQYGEPG